jgi:HAD superfamily hydrolase (TIGR01509 family)
MSGDSSRQRPIPINRGSPGPPRLGRSLTRPVKGLLFDAGDVLYDTTIWRRWLLQLLKRLGVYANYRSLFYIWDHDFLPDVYRGQREFREAFEVFLLSIGLSRAQVDEVVAACQSRRNQWEADTRPLPGVKSTLARLQSAGIALGVVSDCELPAAELTKRLTRFGLGGLFATVVSSLDLGRTMPHPVPYLAALAELKIQPNQAAFVGHDVQGLTGALTIGMQTIAFNFDPEAEADAFIARFDELIELTSAGPGRAAAG